MLRDLNFKAVYRSDEDSILEDFYIPALSVAVSYQRAVGYFSAAMLSCAAQGLSAFVGNNGKMQLIFGGEIDADDAHAIERGYDAREITTRLGLRMAETIDSVSDALCFRRLEALAWLVATGRLEIKVAFRQRGMYHEKIGILQDASGDAVVFQGSANETANALLPDFNFESINVFPCWRDDLSPHFTPYVRGFERLWSNKAKNTWVMDFPEAAKKRLIKIAQKCHVPSLELEMTLARGIQVGASVGDLCPAVPKYFNGAEFVMLPHQLAALNAWKARNLQGILAHSTGSGKTITAVYGATKLFEATKQLALIVAVPYQNLADQWVAVLSQFQMSAIRCYGSRDAWSKQLTEQVGLFAAGATPFICIVVVNRTMQSDEFRSTISRLPGDKILWIGDECHHHASAGLSAALPSTARMRLGLSATPEHYINTEATERLKSFYGDIASEFSLADALAAGVVTPYDYYVHLVSMNAGESKSYTELSEKIAVLTARRADGNEDPDGNDQLKALLMRRARLLGSVEDKFSLLQKILHPGKPCPLSLFYCGDGSTEGDEDDESTRDIDRVTALLYDLGWKCARFTARETREDREQLLSAFRVAAVDALVAIRCLDEGIDVPACRTAYLLASARNPKQFIQRRGRILRKSPGKEYATVHDFVVRLPSAAIQQSPFERRLAAAELARVAEFARLARNSVDAVRTLMPLLKEYDLAHALV